MVSSASEISQDWDDIDFCTTYEQTWEISQTEVHYGWLAPGEHQLELLKDEKISHSNILDLGCGLGQNLISLTKKGAIGFGLDISPSMLSRANDIIQENDSDLKITLEQGDMRELSAFGEIKFDIILSIYSMEYLSGVQELRTVIHNVYNRLNPGGVFILCFSHPSQAHRYPEIMNRSIPQGTGKYRLYNYSIKDTTEALYKAGFSIERIIEQETKNPSKITYDTAREYPYHFREGYSPFIENYDEFSNNSPHTIIYKVRRINEPLFDIPTQKNFNLGYKKLWKYKRKIIKHSSIQYLGLDFKVVHLAPRDNVLGLVDLLTFTISERDLSSSHDKSELTLENFRSVEIPSNSVLGIVSRRLIELGLDVVYKSYCVESGEIDGTENRVLIESVTGLKDEITKEFSTTKIGVLVFVNDHEPSTGELPLDIIIPNIGEQIQVSFIALRDNKLVAKSNQLKLI